MHDTEQRTDGLIKTESISLRDGWTATVVVSDSAGNRFSKQDWSLLAEPQSLLRDAQNTIKNAGRSVVVVKELNMSGKQVTAVIKYHRRGAGLREFFRSLGNTHAIQNFNTAVRTARLGVSVAPPLAAISHRNLIFRDQSFYISQYVPGVNLYQFLNNLPQNPAQRYSITNRLADLLADLFASLHKKGLWHRDAKATNFVVSGNHPDDFRIVLTDMDGIKPYIIPAQTKQFRPLWQLAASVVASQAVRRTDYLRTFLAYCRKVAIPPARRPAIFRLLARKARAKSLQLAARTK